MSHPEDGLPWYRFFWAWVLFGLPAVVVVAALITLGIAITHPDPVVERAEKAAHIRDGSPLNKGYIHVTDE